MGLGNRLKWRAICPTDPEQDIPVKQSTAANLKALVSQASIIRTIQEPLSVDDNGGSLTIDAVDSAPLQVRGLMPSGATPYSLYDSEAGGTSIIHTVTASKTFYMVAFSFSAINEDAVVQTADFGHRDDNDANSKYPIRFRIPSGGYLSEAIALPIPMELDSGHDIFITTSDADCYCRGWIFGYEL